MGINRAMKSIVHLKSNSQNKELPDLVAIETFVKCEMCYIVVTKIKYFGWLVQERFYQGFVHSKNCFKPSFVRLRRRRESVPVIFPSLVVTERQKTSQTKVSKASSPSPTHSKVNQHGGDKSFENKLSSSLKGVTSRFLPKKDIVIFFQGFHWKSSSSLGALKHLQKQDALHWLSR